ncbi:MAG: hypothetical protein GYA55_12370 [SAR324 cluster bacterium]|uniref:Uncharacterized protein n=1 Tax=SAR324 cluster bacterium TaxID=2024889 RepID=A0A7X9FTE6_9DELT|nr:hypothetical protein [SAR324 cluster bacterium]
MSEKSSLNLYIKKILSFVSEKDLHGLISTLNTTIVFILFLAAGFSPLSIEAQENRPNSNNSLKLDKVGQEATPISEEAKIFKHYRFNEGEPLQVLPTATPPFDSKKLLSEIIGNLDVANKEFPSEEEILKNMEAPILKRCNEDLTKTEALGEELPPGLEGDKAPIYDILFIASEEIPENYEEVFGASTIVVPYDTNSPNISWSFIKDLNVPCVPYRLRAQGDSVYVDQGKNALKNYVNGPSGQWHEDLKDQMKEEKARLKKTKTTRGK